MTDRPIKREDLQEIRYTTSSATVAEWTERALALPDETPTIDVKNVLQARLSDILDREGEPEEGTNLYRERWAIRRVLEGMAKGTIDRIREKRGGL